MLRMSQVLSDCAQESRLSRYAIPRKADSRMMKSEPNRDSNTRKTAAKTSWQLMVELEFNVESESAQSL